MSPQNTHLRAIEHLQAPLYAQGIAETGLDVLLQAHNGILANDELSVKTSTDTDATRAYIERRGFGHSLDYEQVAVHLGQSVLFISMDHRHVHGDVDIYSRHTVAFQNGKVELFRSGIRGLNDEDITENEAACQSSADRLMHTLATLGIQQAQYTRSLSEAS